MVTIFILNCIANEILEQFISIFFVCMKQFRYFEKATKFEINLPLFFKIT